MRSGRTSLRRATPDDAKLLWLWRNDPVVRQYSFTSAPIPYAEHEVWFFKRLHSPDTRLYILEEEGVPVAQVRYERKERRTGEVHLSVSPDRRNRGYGKKVLSLSMNVALEDLGLSSLEASVKGTNEPSLKLFLSMGFQMKNCARQGEEDVCLFVWEGNGDVVPSPRGNGEDR